jgi:hypothetical protein
MTRSKLAKRTAGRAENIATQASPAPIPSIVGALKLKDAARYLSISEVSLYRLVDRGLIRPNRMLRHLLFPISELNRVIEEGMTE